MSLEQYLKNNHTSRIIHSDEPTSHNTQTKIAIMQAVKDRISLDRTIDIFSVDEAKKKIQQSSLRWIEEEVNNNFTDTILSTNDKYDIYELLLQNMFGFGVIEPLLLDPKITEIMINGKDTIFFERNGKLRRAKDKRGRYLSFTSGKELKNIIDKIVAPINRKVDESNPVVDARLPDGSRVNIVLSPISLDGAAVTIRKFPEHPYSMSELITFGTLTEGISELLLAMVKAKYNIIVSGGTGSGKTTFLNALSMAIPSNDRVITIEDSAELKFDQIPNLVRMETRPPNSEDSGGIDIRSLVRTALRMRPDRIVVGEIRSGEALDMLQAMNTGHDGSLSTGHANSAGDMLLRLETMVLMSGLELPVSAIRHQIASAVDIIVHVSKIRDGSRKVVQITEVLGYENGEVSTQDLYRFEETGDESQTIGTLKSTGSRLNNVNKFKSAGIYSQIKDCLEAPL